MNFFRKKTHIFASFGEKDLSDPPAEIQKQLESLLPIPDGLELRISISENTDLNMDALCVFSYFSNRERNKGTRIFLKAKPEVIKNLTTLGLSDYFDGLLVGE